MLIESFSVLTNPIVERIIIKRNTILDLHCSRNSFRLTEYFIRLLVVSPLHLFYISMTAGRRGRSMCENLVVDVAELVGPLALVHGCCSNASPPADPDGFL